MQSLLIVAAGKSSRFGGYPKAFARIGKIMNIENTVQQALKASYEKIYVAVNEETYAKFKSQLDGCEMFSIITGNGEAHSLLKCLRHIHTTAPEIRTITVCWGDAYFVNERPFLQLQESLKSHSYKVSVCCAVDREPYAWFETDGEDIKKAHFAKEDGVIGEGIHDQSLFSFDIETAIRYLTRYKSLLHIPDSYNGGENEMRLLRSFEYLYKSEDYPAAKCVMVDAGNVLSFNTQDELSNIEQRINRQK